MRLKTITAAVLLGTLFSAGAAAQNAGSVISAASKAMGAENLNSITYSGTARNGAFGQSKSIGDPMGPVNVTQVNPYTRTITLVQPTDQTALVSRASGTTQPPVVPGVPAPMPGTLNQNITAQQMSTNFGQALNVLTTPWGFLKAAAASNATVRQQGGQQVVSFSPPNFKSPSGQSYTVTGYINNQNLVTKVETRVEHAVVGDLLVEFEYSNYQNMSGLQIPTRIVQKQAGLTTFDATIKAATANPPNLAELLTPPPAPGRGGGPGGAPPAGAAPAAQGARGAGAPPAGAPAAGAPAAGRGAGGPPAGGPPAGGAPQAAAAAPVEKLGEGAFKIGGNYTSLAVDMGDHVLVVESGQNDARGLAVMAAAKQAIPNKPIRFVVNSHPHFDHASGLAAAVAEGATILTHRNNEEVLERLLAGPRTLMGDSLSKVTNRRTNVVEGVGDRDVRKGTNGKVVELHRIPNEHSDGMLAVYLPAEKVLWSADITVVNPNPAQLGVVKAAAEAIDRLKLDYNSWIPAHPPNPDRPLTKTDVTAALTTPAKD
ncbi:MAG TPA: MBL fold metallo-hydrolase [Terriglobia bacterium]|nr:MBL fold metallo-hydrolase [Terriglobia bacterium]